MRVATLLVATLLVAGCTSAPEEPTDTDTGMPPQPETETPTNATFEWGDPSAKTLRPGIRMGYEGAGCTTSFLFHHDGRLFMATAAHCVAGGNPCDADRKMPAEKATLRLTDGTTAEATVAYHAWTTMSRIKEKDSNTCAGNDFALLEINATEFALAHPASLHFRAPTGLATSPTTDIWGFGASSLKGGVQQLHPKQGRHLGMAYDGWKHHVYLVTPGIPGDSGGHILTSDGQALGIASTVAIAPVTGSNHYTDIAKSLEYMREHEGWAPEIVTWDDFHASLAP